MRDYSFRYLDAHGRTQASDYLKLLNNDAAIAFGRECLARSDVVEVWAGNKLVITLKADSSGQPPPTDEIATEAGAAAGAPTTLVRRHPPSESGVEVASLPPWIRPVR
jgi:hypothetical protein